MWGTPDRYRAIADSAERRAAKTDELVTVIAEALTSTGEYVARVPLQPTQDIVDFTWAAREAGRRLGIHVDIDKLVRKSFNGFALVRIRSRTQ